MPRRQYRSPPVHEVILDLRFEGQLDPDALAEIRTKLAGHFDEVSPATAFQFQTGVGPAGPSFRGGAEFLGWEFATKAPRLLLRAHANQVSLHAVRAEKWPAGEYLGWDRIHARFSELIPGLRTAYGTLTLLRAGLRYINRVAVPVDSSLENWFTMVPEGPDTVTGLVAFGFQSTWAEVSGFPGFGASLRLGKTPVPRDEQPPGSIGILLDVDVFNLKRSDAPDLGETAEWFSVAHSAENEIFESCITDQLRARFDLVDP